MTSFAAQERQALVDALLAAGPQAPTLCEGWTAHDLAAHLVVRERRPDASPGLILPLFAGYTERVRRSYLERPFEELVELVRTGPPRLSAFALPGVDARTNLGEHFVHCEDVRRAAPTWQARDLPNDLQEALWGVLGGMTRIALRRSKDPVRLVRPPAELLLHAYNRTAVAQVRIEGDDAAVARFRALKMGL